MSRCPSPSEVSSIPAIQGVCRKYCPLLVPIALGLLLAVGAPAAANNSTTPLRTYDVTIQNLTSGQALTPPVVVTHTGAIRVFQVGEPAGPAVQAIAENGNNTPLLEALAASDEVSHFMQAGDNPLVPADDPGNTELSDAVSVIIDANCHGQFLSVIGMLVCTNDGFTGLNSILLPARGSQIYLVAGYDAGTEINTEDFADLVPPCAELLGLDSNEPGTGESNPALAQGGVIAHHPGIQGTADLDPNVTGWRNPVAKIVITHVDESAGSFGTELSGAGEVPPVFTFSTGVATFELDAEESSLQFSLDVRKISGVMQAHIHQGPPSENAPVVAFLFGPVDPMGLFCGRLSEGVITEADLVGPLAGDWEAFLEALRAGGLYVNVHTADNPGGEIRGQIGAIPTVPQEP